MEPTSVIPATLKKKLPLSHPLTCQWPRLTKRILRQKWPGTDEPTSLRFLQHDLLSQHLSESATPQPQHVSQGSNANPNVQVNTS